MIIWIDGAFGAGKTTLAETLRHRLPDAMAFDPEDIGLLLSRSVPMAGIRDFQDIPLWRKLTARLIAELFAEYGKTMIVPMTVVNADYRREIFGALDAAGIRRLHVFLDVPAGELRRRIELQTLMPHDPDRDDDARRFRLANVERCVAARAHLPQGTLVLPSGSMTPAELAAAVMLAADLVAA